MTNRHALAGLIVVIFTVALILTGCGQDPKRDQPSSGNAVPKHGHVPPHGGTAVELGEEEFHLELVLDRAAGRLTAYVFDGHLENFVRVQARFFEIEANDGTGARILLFTAVTNQSTGEKEGDTSMFGVTADWLKSVVSFDGKLRELDIKGNRYAGVAFNFPKGNETSGQK